MRFSLFLGVSSVESLRASLEREGVRTNAYAAVLFPSVSIAEVPRTVVVDVRTIGGHGLSEGATLDVLLAHVAARGFSAAPLEAAIALRLAWRALDGARVTVVSPRPTQDESAPRGFYLRDDDEGRWLRAFVASDDWVFTPDERVALVVDESA